MPAEPEAQSKPFFKNPTRYTSAVLVVVVFVVGWILFSRWWENRAIESRAKAERTQKQQEQDRITLEQLGGKELAIQNFYATPGVVRRGEIVTYDVEALPFGCSRRVDVDARELTPEALEVDP